MLASLGMPKLASFVTRMTSRTKSRESHAATLLEDTKRRVSTLPPQLFHRYHARHLTSVVVFNGTSKACDLMREHSSGTVRENSPALYYPENPKDMLCFQTKMVDLEGCNKSPKDLEDFNYQNEVKRHRQDTESDITNISQHTNSI
ncbi:hypothetical protein TNCT_197951, partial [Trichonephila clavata]